MFINEMNKLDNIINKTLNYIDSSKEEVVEISTFINDQYIKLEEEFIKLKQDAEDIIKKVNELEIMLAKSRSRLLKVNKEHDRYTEEEMKRVYEETDKYRIQLALEYNREKNVIQRRNELEIHLKTIKKIADKANNLNNNFQFAHNVLSGDLNEISNDMDNIQSKEIWGLKVIEAQEVERQRISREMHDGPAQSLSNLILKVELCIKLLDKDINRTRLELQSLKSIIRGTIDEARRMIYNLRPMALDDLGLIPTLERYIDKVRCDVDFNIEFEVLECQEDINSVISLTLYRIVQEALNNARKYSNARNVLVMLKYSFNRCIELTITDDGDGFDLDNIKLNMENNRGFGISMMRERTNLLMGHYNIRSEIGSGTSIYVKIPVLDVNKEDA